MRRNRTAFTLIELLVVIAIIAVLDRCCCRRCRGAHPGRGRSAQQFSSDRALAIHLYAKTTAGVFPKTSHHHRLPVDQAWIYTLSPSSKMSTASALPFDPKARERLDEQGTSYVFSEYYNVPGEDEP